MKIKDLQVNQTVNITLVVVSAVARETKAKKPYLSLEFYDGTDTISGNYWDWLSTRIPDKNAILDVSAQVTEWQGVKQLNIKGMTVNQERHLCEFMPVSGHNVEHIYKNAYALMSDVQDDFLRALALGVLEDLSNSWLNVPGAKGVHHAYVAGTLIHSYSVAKTAKAIAEVTEGANVDLCTVGGMLHDLGKLFTYEVSGLSIEMTDEGMLYDHLFMGAEFIGNYSENIDVTDELLELKLEMLRHIILSHHGSLEYGAVVTPLSIDAHIVYHADSIDAAAEQVRAQSSKNPNAKWTDKIWALNNRPHLTTQYVGEVMQRRS